MINRNIKTLYNAKANDSFRTKLNLFLFDSVMNGESRFDLEGFTTFEITKQLVDLYTTVYWQQEAQQIIEPSSMSCNEIYIRICDLIRNHPGEIKEFKADYVINRFPEIFDYDDFVMLVMNDHCDYCGITNDEINALADKHQLRKKNFRGWTLEIDRLDSNLEYSKDNCVLACYWCNNAKTDEFTFEEFKEVGKVIRKIWDKRLKG